VFDHCSPFDAINAASDYCRKFPGDPTGRVLLASAHIANQDPQKAIAEVERAEEMRGPTSYTRATKAWALFALGRQEEAIALAEEDLDLPGANMATVRAFQQVGGELSETKMLQFANAFRAGGAVEDYVSAFVADWYRRHGQFTTALTVLNEALVRSPRDVDLSYELGITQFLSGNETEGLRRIRDAFDFDPSHSASAIWLIAYYRRHRRIGGLLRVTVRYVFSQMRIRPTIKKTS
jgi:tetratricopeptide (TPR) repeat protein